jgi:hypothetical protein
MKKGKQIFKLRNERKMLKGWQAIPFLKFNKIVQHWWKTRMKDRSLVMLIIERGVLTLTHATFTPLSKCLSWNIKKISSLVSWKNSYDLTRCFIILLCKYLFKDSPPKYATFYKSFEN